MLLRFRSADKERKHQEEEAGAFNFALGGNCMSLEKTATKTNSRTSFAFQTMNVRRKQPTKGTF
jgi:hypothetical protein